MATPLKLPEICHGLSPERVQQAVNLDAIIPALKQAISQASENQPTMTEFYATSRGSKSFAPVGS
jgi:hypothetical protein